MKYKIKETSIVFPASEISAYFPNTSLPATLTPGDLEFLGIEVIQDTVDEIAAKAAAAAETFKRAVVNLTQERLDAFARTRNYDGILSACTYATSSITKFRLEGQYCVDIRDQTWATLYQILDDVQNGIRTMPTDYQEVEPLLPVLVWPT